MLKGAMVSNSALAAVSVQSGLYRYLRFQTSHLAKTIQTYVDVLKLKESEEYSAAARDGRPPGQYWHDVEPPKPLADIVESIIGALYLSDNFSPAGVNKFFAKVLKPFYDKHISLQTLSHHPTKVLFELFQSKRCQRFEILREGDNCLVLVHGVVLASAQESNAAAAARRASVCALDAIEGDPGFLTRTCNCWSATKVKQAEEKVFGDVFAGFAVGDVVV
ncbi:Dicer-like protein 1 [Marasmius crinis-equi]|uniref:Dicer-like protein 1 n=1 Tax=Marasmius crinis-equi TaxID=585013 RepID=A0ABR3F6K3_9AGAR